MRTYEMYFSGPVGHSDRDPKFPHAPTPNEMYRDFREMLKKSGYKTTRSYINTVIYPDGTKKTVIEVEGMRP